jgi:hypothetical protein
MGISHQDHWQHIVLRDVWVNCTIVLAAHRFFVLRQWNLIQHAICICDCVIGAIEFVIGKMTIGLQRKTKVPELNMPATPTHQASRGMRRQNSLHFSNPKTTGSLPCKSVT